MKRLWMRLGIIASVLAIGGAGVIVAQRGGSTKQTEPAPRAVAENKKPPSEEATTRTDTTKPIPIEEPGTHDPAASPSPPAGTSYSISGDSLLEEAAQYVEDPPVRPAAQYDGLAQEPPAQWNVDDEAEYRTPKAGYGDPKAGYGDPKAGYGDLKAGYGDSEAGYGDPSALAGPYSPASSYLADSRAAESPAAPSRPAESHYAGRYGDDASTATLDAPREMEQGLAATYATAPSGERAGSPPIETSQPPPPDEAIDSSAATNVVADQSGSPAKVDTPRAIASQEITGQGTQAASGTGEALAPPELQPARDATSSITNQIADASAAQAEQAGSNLEASSAALREDTLSAPSPASGSSLGTTQLAAATPGQRELEGTQTPSLTLEKKAPAEISVGQAATFEVLVRNVGSVTAHQVAVTDRVPQGTELVDASPEFQRSGDGAVIWQLGDLDPGDRATITMELVPLVEGEIGSVAQVSFQAMASVRTVATKPELVVEHSGPEQVLKGEDVVFQITLANPGTGEATGVVLEEDVPEGLAHVAGRQLEYEVGTLRPGEKKQLELILKADQPGVVRNLLNARADGGLSSSDEVTLEVTAPQLEVAIGGPTRRYLERQVTYQINVANPGTATAYNIELVTFLPKGLKYLSSDSKGTYDARNHAVYWSLAELEPQGQGSVQLTALPTETGEWKVRLEGSAELDLQAEYEHTTSVEALTELVFTVQDIQDPIEVGRETTYEIRIVNNGNKTATNVQAAASLPAELTPLRGDGPTRVIVEDQTVSIEPIDEIGPREEAVYRIVAQGLSAGDHVINVQLASDEVPKAVTKQESTKVYSDR